MRFLAVLLPCLALILLGNEADACPVVAPAVAVLQPVQTVLQPVQTVQVIQPQVQLLQVQLLQVAPLIQTVQAVTPAVAVRRLAPRVALGRRALRRFR